MEKRSAECKKPEKPAERWAGSVTHLAAALGVTRQTIHRWQKEDDCPRPRSNGNFLISEWEAFAQEKGTAGAKTSKQDEEIRKIKAQADKLEFWLAVDRGEFTANDVIADEIRRMCGETITILEDELVTKMSPAIRKHTRAALDRAMERLSKGSEAAIVKLSAPKGKDAAQ